MKHVLLSLLLVILAGPLAADAPMPCGEISVDANDSSVGYGLGIGGAASNCGDRRAHFRVASWAVDSCGVQFCDIESRLTLDAAENVGWGHSCTVPATACPGPALAAAELSTYGGELLASANAAFTIH